MGRQHSVPPATQEHGHQQVEIRVSVGGEDEGREAGLGDIDVEFFVQFSDRASSNDNSIGLNAKRLAIRIKVSAGMEIRGRNCAGRIELRFGPN